jgi:hypothetical protein
MNLKPTEPTKPHLVPIRFGEFLYERNLITDEQLLEALGEHWSNGGRLGTAIARQGILSSDEVERAARADHGLEIIEID